MNRARATGRGFAREPLVSVTCPLADGPGPGEPPPTRREFLRQAGALATTLGVAPGVLQGATSTQPASLDDKALVAITMDLEMARNFPRWEDTHWDYEKGNLNDAAKKYAVAAGRRVRDRGGVIHYFLVGSALEQENVEWLSGLIRDGHPVANHTYDHVYVLARKKEDVQYIFKRCPWLLEGQTVEQTIEENIRLCTLAMQQRLGIPPAGFRTPGGFVEGLSGRPDVQQMLLRCGFKWVSCRYPAHPVGERPGIPTPDVFDAIVRAQHDAQPFVYPTGLIDVPMSPISDIGAFRNGRWKLDDFMKSIRMSLEYVIEHRLIFDFLCHPSVIGVVDPDFRTIDMICDIVEKAGRRAAIVDLAAMASRARSAAKG